MGAALIGRFLGAGLLGVEEATAARLALGLDAKTAEGEAKPPVVINVHSSAIRMIAYIEPDTIVVEFVRGGSYTYDGDIELFMAFASSPSKGSFFNNHFRKG